MALPMFGTATDFGPAPGYGSAAGLGAADDAARDEIVLQPPPQLPKPGGGQGMQQLVYVLLPMVGMGGMSALYLGRGGNGALTWIVVGVSALGLVGMVVLTLLRGGAQKKTQINDERRDYLRYLNTLRGKVRDVAQRQTGEARTRLPAPEDLWAVIGTERMWRRRIGDANFARVRVASGPQLLETPLRVPETAPLEDLDPVSSAALRRFIRAHATVPELPVAVSLRAFDRIVLTGDRATALGLARAMVSQLAAFHSPADLRIAACLSPDRHADWEWLKWLPHAVDPARPDAAGPGRLCAPRLADLAELLLDDDVSATVVILDGGAGVPADLDGVTVIDVSARPAPPTGSTLDLVVEPGRLGRRTKQGVSHLGVPDRMDAAAADLVARGMTALYTSATAYREDAPITGTVGLADLLSIGDPRALDPAISWRTRGGRDRLRIPIGVDPEGRPVDLDLKESAEGGMGPHGLVIGATGSGKSELLRTLVTGLVVTHSSETLNLALVDFKGGATFAGMAGLPHTCAVITNLSDELSLVDRMGDALRGEMVRRQELLRAAGNYASVRDYERAREAGADLRPLPSLLVVIDEFSELLTNRPEFTELFVMIGRLGRSLAIHLLLASQRLEEGRLRGLDSHLSYRIGLRTFSASESRAVLGVPDAYELPPVPGSGYLKVDTSTMVRFKCAYVSGPLPVAQVDEATGYVSPEARPVLYTLAPAPVTSDSVPSGPAPVAGPDLRGPSIMTTMLDRLTGKGPAAHQIWLPPLGDPPTVDQLMPGLRETGARGYTLPDWPGVGKLSVPVALVDKPFEQRRDLLWADLSGAAGHAIVVGSPQSGKSNLLRTLIATLALTHTPAEVQFFMLDFGGGGLTALAGLPHVSGCAGRLDADRCRRIVAELTVLLAERERAFTERGVDSMAAFRSAPFTGPDGRTFGDVFLVIDGWLTLRQEFEALEEAVTALAARGLAYGIHVVLSANRWMEIRAALRDLVGTQFELRLGDPSDSAIDRRAAANVPAGVPGRGLTGDRLQFLTALPRVDERASTEDLSAGVADLVRRIDTAWTGARAPQVRLLPKTVPATALPAPVGGDRRIPIGLAELDLAPVYLDFGADPHFVAFGDIESGKSGLLRLLARAITGRFSPDQAAISIVDYRRSLLGVVDGPHLLDYCGSESAVTEAVRQIEAAMKHRLPGPDVTPEQLRNRDWWQGPELFVLVDDYDLVVTPGGNPLAPLAAYLPQARDIGLHVVLVRRTGGAGRAMFEPVLQRLRDVATPGLVLSGSRDEGALVGDVKPGPQPPGRGYLVTRRTGAALVQLAWLPPV